MGDKPTVLVTRPVGQAAGLCSGLQAMGYEARSQPMLELVAVEQSPELQRHIVELDQYQHVIFISGNAVQFGMAWIQASWPTLPAVPHWYAIGDATAGRLRDYGVEASSSGAAMTSESLLENPALRDVAGQRVLIVKGRGGRVSLGEGLTSRGARVDELSCYRRIPPVLSPGELSSRLANWCIGLILISSGEGLRNMLTLLGPQKSAGVMTVPLIVPSGRVALMAGEMGFTTVYAAQNASDAAMLQAVQSWQNDTVQAPAGSGE